MSASMWARKVEKAQKLPQFHNHAKWREREINERKIARKEKCCWQERVSENRERERLSLLSRSERDVISWRHRKWESEICVLVRGMRKRKMGRSESFLALSAWNRNIFRKKFFGLLFTFNIWSAISKQAARTYQNFLVNFLANLFLNNFYTTHISQHSGFSCQVNKTSRILVN